MASEAFKKYYCKHRFIAGAGTYIIGMYNGMCPKQPGASISTVELYLPEGTDAAPPFRQDILSQGHDRRLVPHLPFYIPFLKHTTSQQLRFLLFVCLFVCFQSYSISASMSSFSESLRLWCLMPADSTDWPFLTLLRWLITFLICRFHQLYFEKI